VSKRVEEVMRQVDRRLFVPPLYAEAAYEDAPLPIGAGQTISAPHMHGSALGLIFDVMSAGAGARAASAALPQQEAPVKCLDVGTGSGYFSALVATAFPNAQVYGVECFAELVKQTQEHCAAAGGRAALVHVRLGDGWEGLQDEAPFDAIHVGAAAASVPHALLAQLKVGGRLIIPVGQQGSAQQLLQIDRLRAGPTGAELDMADFQVEEKAVVAFVPLIENPADVAGSASASA